MRNKTDCLYLCRTSYGYRGRSMEFANLPQQRFPVRDCPNASECGLKRLRAQLIDCVCVHTGRVEVAEEAGIRSLPGIRRSQMRHHIFEYVKILVGARPALTPACLAGWNWILRQPFAH